MWTLHTAVGLMDLFICLIECIGADIQLIGVAAMNVAVRQRNPDATINYDALCKCFQGGYTEEQVRISVLNSTFFNQIKEMEKSIIQTVGENIGFPVAPTFLEFFLGAMSEYPPCYLAWVYSPSDAFSC